MQEFKTLTSRVVPLIQDDIDTDQITPARFLKVTDKKGMGAFLFWDWRYEADESPRASFVLNQAQHAGAQVLLSGHNFGCGSSREHAPWALVDFGFRAIIAVSFADIFRNNALKNGLLPVAVPEETIQKLSAELEEKPEAEVRIDLLSQTLRLPGGDEVGFEVDAFAKKCLLNGKDQLGYLLSFEPKIAAFEAQRAEERGG